MAKSLKIYIGLLVLLFAVIIIIDANKPKPVNWTPTYSINDKIPLGLYVLNQQINHMFNGNVNRMDVTAYEYFSPLYDYDTLVNTYKVRGSFINISAELNLDEESVTEIMYFVGHGNSAFLSMKTLPPAILDSLDLEMQFDYQMSDSVYQWLANPLLDDKKYVLREGFSNSYFTKIDTLNTTVLGYQSRDEPRANFIKVPYRSGHFYLHTQPAAFSNFHLLKDNHAEYAEKVLSYLPESSDLFWYTKDLHASQRSDSPLRFILTQPALSAAWFLFLAGMIVFMLFNAKRKQRVVPIIQPLTNTTVEFTKTIGNLYLQEGDYDAVIDKKIVYFLEKIRNQYLIDTTKLDEDFARKLAQKSGKDPQLIRNAINRINSHRRSRHASVESDLIEINTAIENIL